MPASGGGKYIGVYNTPTDSDEYLGKYDENIGDKDHVTATYFFVKTKSTPSGGGNINWTGNQSAAAQTNATLADVHTFSPSIANQTWLTFTRAMGGRTLIPVTGPANQTLGQFSDPNTTNPFLIQGPAGLPYLNITATFNTGNPNAGPVTGSDNYELRDVVSITKGKHSLSIGGEFALDKTMFLANLNNYGDVTFATSAPTSTGNAIGDFITGQTSAFEQDSTYVTHLSTWHVAAFLQDNYRITPRFTANLGIRWDIDTPPVDAHNRTSSFVPGQQSTVTLSNLLPPLLRWYRRGTCSLGIRASVAASSARRSPTFRLVSVLHGTRLEMARPRFAPRPASSSVPPAATSGTSPATPCRSPFATALAPLHLSQICTVAPLTTSPAPLPAEASSRTFIRRPIRNSTEPKALKRSTRMSNISSVYQFNLSVQRQLPYNITASAAYVGTLGRHLQTFVDANYAPYATVNAFGATITPTTSSPAPAAPTNVVNTMPAMALPLWAP